MLVYEKTAPNFMTVLNVGLKLEAVAQLLMRENSFVACAE